MADLEYQQKNYLSARGFIERYMDNGKLNASVLWLAMHIEQGLGNSSGASNYAQRLKIEYPNAPETRQLSGERPG
jgi:type IV pilus assembly protein PilF